MSMRNLIIMCMAECQILYKGCYLKREVSSQQLVLQLSHHQPPVLQQAPHGARHGMTNPAALIPHRHLRPPLHDHHRVAALGIKFSRLSISVHCEGPKHYMCNARQLSLSSLDDDMQRVPLAITVFLIDGRNREIHPGRSA